MKIGNRKTGGESGLIPHKITLGDLNLRVKVESISMELVNLTSLI